MDRDPHSDGGFQIRAKQRRERAWVRFVPRHNADDDDPDDPLSTPADRVALVDTLTLLSLRLAEPNGTEPRLQRSAARLL
jgi:hypothetical protein